MKHLLLVALVACAITGQAFAGWGGPGIGPSGHGLPEAGDSGSDLVSVTVTGEASPILDQDAEGNSLFFGYYLKAETLSISS
jgi:hypothetical protein